MAEGNSMFAWVEVFGPSSVLLFAVLLTVTLVWKYGGPRRFDAPSRFGGHSIARTATSDDLEIALDNAVSLNSFNVQGTSDPSVRLQAVIRFAPSDFKAVVAEISRHFRTGRVVSI